MMRGFFIVLAFVIGFGAPSEAWRIGRAAVQYEGLVASRARMFTVLDQSGNTQTMCRSAHIATENLTAIKVAFASFYNGGNIGGVVIDTGSGAATSVKFGIEYPAGTFVQGLFSGSSGGSIPDVGVLWSDYAAVNIPTGATFWIRPLRINANGIFFNQWQNSFLGEACEIGGTLSDKTISGTISNVQPWSTPPLAIVGLTTNASVIIAGDSLAAGTGDVEDSSASALGYNGKIGVVARSLGNIPFVNIGRGSAQAQFWATEAVGADAVVQKGSHLAIVLGSNDINGGRTAAQVIADVQTVAALGWTSQKKYPCTILPRATSSDNFATLVNQTTQLPFNTIKNTYNATALAILAGTTGTYDLASSLESSSGSGLWVAATPPNVHSDGVHPEPPPQGYQLIVNAGVVSPVSWP